MAGTYLLLRDETCALERIGFFSIWLKSQVPTPNGSEDSVCVGCCLYNGQTDVVQCIWGVCMDNWLSTSTVS